MCVTANEKLRICLWAKTQHNKKLVAKRVNRYGPWDADRRLTNIKVFIMTIYPWLFLKLLKALTFTNKHPPVLTEQFTISH